MAREHVGAFVDPTIRELVGLTVEESVMPSNGGSAQATWITQDESAVSKTVEGYGG